MQTSGRAQRAGGQPRELAELAAPRLAPHAGDGQLRRELGHEEAEGPGVATPAGRSPRHLGASHQLPAARYQLTQQLGRLVNCLAGACKRDITY